MWQRGDKPIEGYTLERFLGAGSFGEVWRAQGPGGVPAALKFIGLDKSSGLKEYRGIQRVKQIRHANLLPMTGIWALDQENRVLSEGALAALEAQHGSHRARVRGTLAVEQSFPATLVVAMPLGERSLWDRFVELREAGCEFPIEELLIYIEDAAGGIDHLNKPIHNLGREERVAIQHCDIKPGNIMLLGESAQICDFGLAHILDQDGARMTGAGQATGTIAYMSPECADGKPTGASDQYSLAITYYEMRTGELPFSLEDRRSLLSLVAAHREGRLDLTRLDGPEREVIVKATSVTPETRFANALEMVQALRRAVGREGTASVPVETGSEKTAPKSGGSSSRPTPHAPVARHDLETVSASQWESEADKLPTCAEPPATRRRRLGRRTAMWLAAGLATAMLAAVAGGVVFWGGPKAPQVWLPRAKGGAFEPASDANIVSFRGQNLYDRIQRRFDEGMAVEFVLAPPPDADSAPFYIMSGQVTNQVVARFLAEHREYQNTQWLTAWREAADQRGAAAPAVHIPARVAHRLALWLGGETGNLPLKKQWRRAAESGAIKAPEGSFDWTRDWSIADEPVDEDDPFRLANHRTMLVVLGRHLGSQELDERHGLVFDKSQDRSYEDIGVRPVIRVPLLTQSP
jgi:serine/threonine protein kinase